MIGTLSHRTTASRASRSRICRIVVLLQLLLPILSIERLTAEGTKPAINKAESIGQVSRKAEAPIKTSAVLYQPLSHKDPFLNPMLLAKKDKPGDEELARGVPPPGIAGTSIAQAVLQGVAVRENRRVAIIRGADTHAYFLKEGDRLFDGYLKAINSDSVTLIRETRMRSGKILTQDVTKRLRTP